MDRRLLDLMLILFLVMTGCERIAIAPRIPEIETDEGLQPQVTPTFFQVMPSATSTQELLITEANPILTIVPAVSPGPGEDEWTTFVMDRPYWTYKGFRLHYPQSWKLTAEFFKPDPEYDATMSLVLEKSGYTIEIMQGDASEGPCIYPGETTTLEFFARHGDYKEFDKGNRIYWRRAMPENQSPGLPLFKVCEVGLNANISDPFTAIGWINLKGPSIDETILGEFDEILEKIEILE